MAVAARLPIDRVLERAHDHVYKGFESHTALVKELTRALGRPTIARLTGTPDLKTVTRWSLGRNQPSDDRLELLRGDVRIGKDRVAQAIFRLDHRRLLRHLRRW